MSKGQITMTLTLALMSAAWPGAKRPESASLRLPPVPAIGREKSRTAG